MLNEAETSTTGIKLEWHPISKRFWSGEQVTFEVNITSADHVFLWSYSTKATSIIISKLEPTTTYFVTIRGITVFGPFPVVNKIEVTTKESKFTIHI